MIRLLLLVTIALTVGCDRMTKHLAGETLAGSPIRSYLGDSVRLLYAENTGGFLSLGSDLPVAARTAVFTVGTGLVLLVMIVFLLRNRFSALPAFGLALFVAGGLSNWVDRAMHGAVVDFLNIGIGPLRTGIFNVADVAMMVGVGIVIVAESRRGAER